MNRKIALISIPTGILGIGVSALLAFKFHHLETQSIQGDFQQDVHEQVHRLEAKMEAKMEVVNSLKLLFDSSEQVNPAEFKQFAHSLLARHKDIQALEWAPKIKHADREAFIQQRQKDFPAFDITQQVSQGKMVRAQQRSAYFPISFLEPFSGNELALGFDLASNLLRRKAIDRATDTGRIQSTAHLTLVQEQDQQKGFITLIPVYRDQPTTLTSRRQRLEGFVLGVFRINDLVKAAIQPGTVDAINLQLIDTANPDDIPYKRRSQLGKALPKHEYRQNLKSLAGQQWTMVATPSNVYFNEKRSGLPLAVFWVGIVFTALIEAYIIFVLTQSRLVETVVRDRTKELEEANKKLSLISTTDELTSIANRRHFDDCLKTEWKRAIREQTPMTLFLINLDFFRQFNEGYGFVAGDDCLKRIGQQLESLLKRPADLVARYEGETFALLLPNTENAEPLAQKCLETVAALKIKHIYSPIHEHITVSIGVAFVRPAHDIPMTKLLEKATQALTQAKDAGRNQYAFIHIPSFADSLAPSGDLSQELQFQSH
ncbi:CHASE domain-containing protein [Acaryochloris sp. IP29b_bin.137]|uniref:CHASE domain-containing protein n=1 Tax=Acaryochloris sp. IP29b_bin.137 TaxID=2969217 RepID=UPI0026061B39|nr:CHASE domain-containing protein [Acaryochloris sp. IP29b_bin.137]